MNRRLSSAVAVSRSPRADDDDDFDYDIPKEDRNKQRPPKQS